MSKNQASSRLPEIPNTRPVYVTRQVAARMLGLHDYTVDRNLEPDAWRRERDGKLLPLYTAASVERFRTEYRDGRVKRAGGGE